MNGMTLIHHESKREFKKMTSTVIKPFHLYRQVKIYEVAQIFIRNPSALIFLTFLYSVLQHSYYITFPSLHSSHLQAVITSIILLYDNNISY